MYSIVFVPVLLYSQIQFKDHECDIEIEAIQKASKSGGGLPFILHESSIFLILGSNFKVCFHHYHYRFVKSFKTVQAHLRSDPFRFSYHYPSAKKYLGSLRFSVGLSSDRMDGDDLNQ